ncbi:MAG: hypothetical protein WA020_00145 [Candidatus Acidiferrales bacterium]
MARFTCDGMLVIDYADRDPTTAPGPVDSEPLTVACDDESPDANVGFKRHLPSPTRPVVQGYRRLATGPSHREYEMK